MILPAADGDVDENPGARFYDAAEPAPLKSQLYIDGANHNWFNRQWPEDDGGRGPDRPARSEHERILSAYGCALFRAYLLSHDTAGYLTGLVLPPAISTRRVHISAMLENQTIVDDHEQPGGQPGDIATNSMGQLTTQLGGLTAAEHDFRQPGTFNATFWGNRVGMVARSEEAGGQFRTALDGPRDVRDREVWVRAADVVSPPGRSWAGLRGSSSDSRTSAR